MPEPERQTHVDPDEGLRIPLEFREFDAQIVFRTPRATIQHFGSTPLDAYYPLIDESHFGDPDEMSGAKNPDLAPDRMRIKEQGEDPVELRVETGVAIPDGGQPASETERHLYMAVIECPVCNQVSRTVEQLDFELPLDAEVPRPPHCPQCGRDLREWSTEWDVQAEYEVETVLPAEERQQGGESA